MTGTVRRNYMMIHNPDRGKYTGNMHYVLLLLLIILKIPSFSQVEPDTLVMTVGQESLSQDTVVSKIHSPHLATIYSMILPGLGQAYNRKYWKIPIIYGGFGVFYYLIRYNNKEYQLYRDAYYHSLINTDGSEPPVNEYETLYSSETLKNAKDDYRRNRDLNYILGAFWYVLNVIDATVDAHLFTWQVDDDLTLRVDPNLNLPAYTGYKPTGGVKLTFHF